MQRKSFEGMQCPVARSLERVGEWWNILILRDALNGVRRFDQFAKNLGIPPSTLSRRLNALIDAQLMEKFQYQDKPPRFEYRLTQAGHDFRPVIHSLLTWGVKYFPSTSTPLQPVISENDRTPHC